MSYLPIPRDDNGHPLLGYGTQSVTYRWSGVPFSGSGWSGNLLFLPIDVKSLTLHIESGTALAAFSGTASGSAVAYWTNSGYTLPEMPVLTATSGTFIRCAAPASGETITISAFGWR